MNTCRLSYETPLLFSSFSPLFLKKRTLLLHPTIRRFRLRTSLRADVHAPAHRALSEFAIPAFTFTHKSLMHSFLRPCGEEVKAKNEKRRTRV